jgi:hypothetical protein
MSDDDKRNPNNPDNPGDENLRLRSAGFEKEFADLARRVSGDASDTSDACESRANASTDAASAKSAIPTRIGRYG